jgi:hypothetical protein
LVAQRSSGQSRPAGFRERWRLSPTATRYRSGTSIQNNSKLSRSAISADVPALPVRSQQRTSFASRRRRTRIIKGRINHTSAKSPDRASDRDSCSDASKARSGSRSRRRRRRADSRRFVNPGLLNMRPRQLSSSCFWRRARLSSWAYRDLHCASTGARGWGRRAAPSIRYRSSSNSFYARTSSHSTHRGRFALVGQFVGIDRTPPRHVHELPRPGPD